MACDIQNVAGIIATVFWVERKPFNIKIVCVCVCLSVEYIYKAERMGGWYIVRRSYCELCRFYM